MSTDSSSQVVSKAEKPASEKSINTSAQNSTNEGVANATEAWSGAAPEEKSNGKDLGRATLSKDRKSSNRSNHSKAPTGLQGDQQTGANGASYHHQSGGPRRHRQRKGGGRHDSDAALAKVQLVDMPPIILQELREDSLENLAMKASELGLELASRPSVQKFVDLIARHHASQAQPVLVEGILEMIGDFGFVRQMKLSYQPAPDDIMAPAGVVRKFGLQTGDEVKGFLRAMRGNEKHCIIHKIIEVNGKEVTGGKESYIEPFEALTPLFPQERLQLETGYGGTEDITGRIIDIVSPIGKGQRGLIVSPPKAGKTIVLQSIAQAIERNSPECELFVLLIDERPEEVTEMRRSVRAQVIASTFDEPASRHVQVTEILNGLARKKVEQGKDVVILLDSITRLARAYNTTQPSSGKILTGGVDANALERPKRFFGGARKIEGGGSLTIIATALVETGSKMDEVIYEEFKGTGNMELHLERKIAEKRIFPAINIRRSSTRREELLLLEEELTKMIILRRLLHSMEDLPAMEFLLEHLRETKTNAEFFESMQRR